MGRLLLVVNGFFVAALQKFPTRPAFFLAPPRWSAAGGEL
jgi:hypothetical protein